MSMTSKIKKSNISLCLEKLLNAIF